MAEAVVHVLEPVEVDEQHPERGRRGGRGAAMRSSSSMKRRRFASPVSGSCDASWSSRSFSSSSPRWTWALCSDAPAWAANSSRLSTGAAGGGSGVRASGR